METLPLFSAAELPLCARAGELPTALLAVPAVQAVKLRAAAEAAAITAKPAAASPEAAVATAAVQRASAPEDLHPALWRASQVGQRHLTTGASGFAALDAVLPGGGWPVSALTELLLPHAGVGEIRLLAPALAAVQAQQRCVVLFDPPALPFGSALQACGLDVQQLFLVRSRDGLRGRARQLLPAADILWALEQTLKSGHVGAVLAWLPARLPADALRRLQLAAQSHEGPAFLLRDESLRSRPSPAPLRLLLRAAGADRLRVQLLKRRGPPLVQPLLLALPPVLLDAAIEQADGAGAARRSVQQTWQAWQCEQAVQTAAAQQPNAPSTT